MAIHLANLSNNRYRTILKWVLAAVAVALITFLMVAISNTPQQSDSSADVRPIIAATESPVPVDQPAVVTESLSGDPIVSIPETPAEIEPIPLQATPIRVVVPDARIDMHVLPLPQSSIIDTPGDEGVTLIPPETPDAYLADRYTQAGSDVADLAMIIAHACKDHPICNQMDWQFNRLSNRALIKKGTELFVETNNGKVCYSVDADPVTYSKETFFDQPDVFGVVPQPGRLVLVSCYTEDLQERVAVVASMKPCDT